MDNENGRNFTGSNFFTHLSPKTPVTVQCVRYLVDLIYNIYEVYIINSGQAVWLSSTNTLPQKMIIQLLTKCYSQLPEGGWNEAIFHCQYFLFLDRFIWTIGQIGKSATPSCTLSRLSNCQLRGINPYGTSSYIENTLLQVFICNASVTPSVTLATRCVAKIYIASVTALQLRLVSAYAWEKSAIVKNMESIAREKL